jgi:hypothetical protein
VVERLDPGIRDPKLVNYNTHGRYAIVLTHNRPELLAQCIEAIGPQVDMTFVVDNASEPPAVSQPGSPPAIFIRDMEQPPNLSRLWNVGMRAVNTYAGFSEERTWDIAYLCDDAIVAPDWFKTVATAIRDHRCLAGSTHCAIPVSHPIVKHAADHDVWNRMCPWAFIVAGEVGILADEDLKWWWGDTHMDFTARLGGGMVVAPGPVVPNLRMNEYTGTRPELMAQSGKDGETFAAKWGRPW